MNDGTLDIKYDITWKVLDSTTEGPLSWVKIGTPNPSFLDTQALTSNIKDIQKYSGSYVKITFDREYYENEEIRFVYTIHQPYMYVIKEQKNTYEFTPAWFTDAKVDKMQIRWNASDVTSANNTGVEDNYLVWDKTNLAKGEKVTAKVEYDKTSFTAISEQGQVRKNNNGTDEKEDIIMTFIMVGIVILIVIIIIASCSRGGPGGYYGGRGFYHTHISTCVHHSSCACACAHSCACACAGSGRAGCSKKDFYGTNLTSKKIRDVINNTNKN